MERTFFLIKPDGFARGLTGEIINRIQKKGLSIEALELRIADRSTAQRHYAEHKGKTFYEDLITFITSGPLIAGILSGEQAITAFRQLAGATDPVNGAVPGTIRGDFGLAVQQNLVHGSDSIEAASREIKIWFPDFE